MRMAFWFVIIVSVMLGAIYLAHTMGWVDVHHWGRLLQDLVHIREWRVDI